MTTGTFYGIGVGPGDPGLLTVKAEYILKRCKNIYVPKARIKSESIALTIAREFIATDAAVREVVFPMTEQRTLLEQHWRSAASEIAAVLASGEDVCFLTLGDTLLYSTYIYLMRALKAFLPHLTMVTIPGVTAFSAAAALTGFPVGEGKNPVVIIPTSDSLDVIHRAIEFGGTVVLMKVGKRLEAIIDLLKEHRLAEQSVFVSRAGLEGERIETDLSILKVEDPHLGYLSTIIVDTRKEV